MDVLIGACDCDGNVLDECGECGGDGDSDGVCDDVVTVTKYLRRFNF